MPNRAHGDIVIRAATIFLVAALLVFSLSPFVQADPAAITQAQKDLQQLKALVDKLDNDLSAADEDYNQATERLKQTQDAQAKTQAQLAKTKSDLAGAQQQLMSRLAEIYKGGDSSMLDVLLGSESFSDLVTRLDQLGRIGEQDNALIQQVKDYLAQVDKDEAQLAQQVKDEKAETAQLADAKQKVAAQLAKQTKALQGKEVQLAELKKEEAARQAALAAAAKKAAAEAAARAAAARAAAAKAAADKAAAAKAAAEKAAQQTTKPSSHTTTTTQPGSGSENPPATNPPADSGGGSSDNSGAQPSNDGGGADSADLRSKVVDIAMQYLGVPYVWAGASPSGFDCSGFAMYVFNKVGISLPHSAAMQFDRGTHVSKANLQPGDLVFFYSPIHHVGIYIGDGKMINARGSEVQIDDAFWDSYVGGTSILN